MRISRLTIRNFKGISAADFSDLADIVIIAGQNGAGKSCVFDAIRLLKSAYGGYQGDEFQQWFGEMKVDFRKPQSLMSIFFDKSIPIVLEMQLSLHAEETAYLTKHATTLFRQDRSKLVGGWGLGAHRSPSMSQQLRSFEVESEANIKSDLLSLAGEIDAGIFTARLTIQPGEVPTPSLQPSVALALLFSNFQPDVFGVIDYHGPHRIYNREPLNAINVDVSSLEQQRANSLLYNYLQKYQHIKNEMAGALLRDLIAREAKVDRPHYRDLNTTLQELFSTFFPGKTFRGPMPTPEGSLQFPVYLATGASHDLDELSSGEKEILYGYLRMRSSASKNSIILIDEPELHLNPRLIRQLPNFYQRNLSSNLNNQIWLVSHSDALLRDAVGRREYSVFHMVGADAAKTNQASRIQVKRELDDALFELVGSLAAYQPGAPLVIMEGDPETSFDVHMTTELFPRFAQMVNLAGVRSKSSARKLHRMLDDLAKRDQLPFRVFSISDKDSDSTRWESTTALEWDAYHIENYLLDIESITSLINDLDRKRPVTAREIDTQLRECAAESVSGLIEHDVRMVLRSELLKSIELGVDPKRVEEPAEWVRALHAIHSRVSISVDNSLKRFEDGKFVSQIAKNYRDSLENQEWRRVIRGRDIIQRMCSRGFNRDVPCAVFRNLIVSTMRSRGVRPSGMESVLRKIIEF